MTAGRWAIVATLVLLVVVLRFIAPPMLLVASDLGAIDPSDVLLVVPNPLRDRAPERVAIAFLGELRAGRCGSLDAETCEREKRNPVQSWSLTGREDDRKRGTSKMHYRVTRRGYQPWSNVWITVARDHGRYRMIDFEAWY